MKNNMRIYYFLSSILGGFFSVAMPLYYDSLQFNSVQVGVIIALPSVVMLLQPLWGVIVDKYEKPKEVAILGLTFSSLFLLNLLFFTDFYAICLIIFCFSLFKAPVWLTVDNIIITYCMNNNLKYGPLRVFASIAWGSSLLIMYPFILLGGFKIFFVINLILSIILGIIIYQFPAKVKLNNDTDKKENTFKEGIKVLLTTKEFYFLTGFTLFFSTIFVTNLNYQALYFEELNYSSLFIAFAMFISIVPELFIMPLIEKITFKRSSIFWLILVCILYIFKYMAMIVINNIYLVLLFISLHGVAMSIYIPVFIKFLKKIVPNNVSTVAITINGFVAAISGITMSLVAGIVRETYNITSVFKIDVLMMGISIIVLLNFGIYLKKNNSN